MSLMNEDKPWHESERKIYRHEFRTTPSEEAMIKHVLFNSGKTLTDLVIDSIKKGGEKS